MVRNLVTYQVGLARRWKLLPDVDPGLPTNNDKGR